MANLAKIDQFDLSTKDEIKQWAQDEANRILEEGNQNPLQLFVRMRKLREFIEQFTREIEYFASEDYGRYAEKTVTLAEGKITEVQGAEILDYEQDLIYAELKQKLAARKQMIDLATRQNETFYDEDGVAVPKVPVKTVRKSSLQIKY